MNKNLVLTMGMVAIVAGCANPVRPPEWRAAEMTIYQDNQVIESRRFDGQDGDRRISLTTRVPPGVDDRLRQQVGSGIRVQFDRSAIGPGGMREFQYVIERASPQMSSSTGGLARILDGEAFEAAIPGLPGGRVRLHVEERAVETVSTLSPPESYNAAKRPRVGPRHK